MNPCEDIPEEFMCPITNQVMRVPYFMPDGYTYEKEAIEQWLKTKEESPFTREPMKIENGKINYNLLNMIDKFRQSLRPQKEKSIKAIINTIEGKKLYLEIPPHISVIELKKLIQNKTNMLPSHMRIMHCARQLRDDANIDDYNIQDNSTLHILGRLLGGY